MTMMGEKMIKEEGGGKCSRGTLGLEDNDHGRLRWVSLEFLLE